MNMKPRLSKKVGYTILGIIMIIIGVYRLNEPDYHHLTYGNVSLDGIQILYPIGLIIAGIYLIYSYLLKRN